MKDFLAKNWVYLVLAVVVAIVAYSIYWGYNYIKGLGVNSVLASAPGKPGSDPYTQDELREIKAYTDRLIADLGGWYTGFWHDSALYEELAKTTDRILVGCYNQYQTDAKSVLTTDMENKLAVNPTVVDNSRIVVKRLKDLIK